MWRLKIVERGAAWSVSVECGLGQVCRGKCGVGSVGCGAQECGVKC